MVACRIGVTSGVWARRKVVFMCIEVGGLRKCCRKMFWGNSPSISLWSNSVCASFFLVVFVSPHSPTRSESGASISLRFAHMSR